MIRSLILLSLLTLTFVRIASADFGKAQEDLRFQLENYNKTHQEYLDNKRIYKQFKTLPTETEAFASLKKVLEMRAKVLFSYFALLQEKLNQTGQIPDQNRNDLTSEITSNRTYFADFEKRALNAKNLTEAQSLSSESENKKKEWENINLKVKGLVFSSNLVDLARKSTQLIEKIKDTLKNNKHLSDFNLREEKIDQAEVKFSQAENAALKAQSAFFQIQPQTDTLQLENLGINNADLAINLLNEGLFNITEAARGF